MDSDIPLFWRFRLQKQPLRSVPWKRCFGKMQQIYRRTPMPRCDFNKVALQWMVSFAWVLSCKFAASQEHLWTAASEINYKIYFN